MQHVVQAALADVLENDVDIRNLGNDAHEEHNVRVPQYALHDDLVLNFLQQIVSEARVENFLNGHGCSVEFADMNSGESALCELISDLQVAKSDLADSRYCRQAA